MSQCWEHHSETTECVNVIFNSFPATDYYTLGDAITHLLRESSESKLSEEEAEKSNRVCKVNAYVKYYLLRLCLKIQNGLYSHSRIIFYTHCLLELPQITVNNVNHIVRQSVEGEFSYYVWLVNLSINFWQFIILFSLFVFIYLKCWHSHS